MSQPLIVLGDRSSHGGTVISCATTATTGGKGVARIGDMVACPRCRGVFPISEGDPSLIEDGKPVAYHGCKTACGATLIASQAVTSTEQSVAAASTTASPAGVVAKDTGAVGAAIGGGLAASYQEQPTEDQQRFKGRFQVVDIDTGEPVAGQSARVRSTGGQYLAGATDAEGFTQWVERDASEVLAFDLADGESQ